MILESVLLLSTKYLRKQAEEDALFFQQYRASENSGEFERRVRPYVKQVFLYEDPVRQEAAQKSVPVDEVEEKALVSLAKIDMDPRLKKHGLRPYDGICRYNKCGQADGTSDIPTKKFDSMLMLWWRIFMLGSVLPKQDSLPKQKESHAISPQRSSCPTLYARGKHCCRCTI
ncbi:uncharacterized protein A4U43_C08F19180 [Asparagus officinalis]|nr:uncharacterized protein A4U43_C08F19180 [Asparagus officinalis]